MYFYLAPLLLKMLVKIICHIGRNGTPFMNANEMLKRILNFKLFILKKLHSVKILLYALTLRIGKANSNENNAHFIQLLKAAKRQILKHLYISEEHLYKYDLHLNRAGTRILAKQLISNVRSF